MKSILVSIGLFCVSLLVGHIAAKIVHHVVQRRKRHTCQFCGGELTAPDSVELGYCDPCCFEAEEEAAESEAAQ